MGSVCADIVKGRIWIPQRLDEEKRIRGSLIDGPSLHADSSDQSKRNVRHQQVRLRLRKKGHNVGDRSHLPAEQTPSLLVHVDVIASTEIS